ncbi:Putative peptidyl-prolyl cis-trans isomerase dodo (PPIase dodo) (Rotamase dodo), partial [Durusdinium trenchii]
SNPGNVYFFNEFSRVSRWDKPEPVAMPDKVRASHILLKHTGSRNPKSRRTGETITRTAEEAIAQLREFQAQIGNDAKKFEEIAGSQSDCNSFKHGGNLGSFGRQKMQKPFEDASFNLAVGEISGIIETDSGFHLILRTA